MGYAEMIRLKVGDPVGGLKLGWLSVGKVLAAMH
jgi:hypothetical protein